MNKTKFSHKLKEILPPQTPPDFNDVILETDFQFTNKENIAPISKYKKNSIKRTLSENQKNYKNLDKNLISTFSLKSGEANFSSLKWLLNSLSKMQLNMNVCYEIIEKMDLDSNFDKEASLKIIIEKYFFIINNYSNERNVVSSNFKKTQALIYKKMFMKKQKNFLNPRMQPPKNSLIIEIPQPLNLLSFSTTSQKRITCVICCEPQNLFKKIPGSNHEFCYNCIKSYLKENIFNNNVLKIHCPDDCKYILTENDVKNLLVEDFLLLSKYEKFKINAELRQNPDSMWCLTPGCENIIKSGKKDSLIICCKCNLQMCIACKGIWHNEQNCEEAIESEYKKYIDHVSVKQCPKCKVRIEKNQGCNHMTCVRCLHQFCWICSKNYTRYHYKWYNLLGCPGLQNVDVKIQYSFVRRLEIVCKIIGYILLGLSLFAFFPLILFFVSIIFPLVYFCNNYKGPCFSLLFFLLFIVSMLITPITMIVLFFMVIGFFIYPKKIILTNE